MHGTLRLKPSKLVPMKYRPSVCPFVRSFSPELLLKLFDFSHRVMVSPKSKGNAAGFFGKKSCSGVFGPKHPEWVQNEAFQVF